MPLRAAAAALSDADAGSIREPVSGTVGGALVGTIRGAFGAVVCAALLASCAGTASREQATAPREPATAAGDSAPAAAEPRALSAMIPVNSNLLPGSPLPGTACRAALVRSKATVRPGGRIRVGVVLELAPHHHVYWTNPGDSGLAPSVAWTLPEGWTAGPIEWPAPRRITADGIVTFGYEGGVVLPVTLTVPDDAPTGDVIVGAYIKWLVCSESACVPGKASAEVRLNVAREPSRDARGPSDDARRADLEDAVTWELLLARTGHLRPAPVPADGARLATAGNAWTLAVDLPTDVGDVRVADFFAEDSLVLDASAVPTIESAENGRVVLRLTPAPRTAARAVRLRGVLVVTAVAQTQAYAIDVPIH